MATLNIGGKRVKVDDAFLSMTPEQQQQTVDEIAAQIGGEQPAAPAEPSITINGQSIPRSQYMAMSNEERQALRSQIAQTNPEAQTKSSVLDPFVQGTTFGWGDEIKGALWGAGSALQGGDFGSVYDQVVDESRNALAHEREVNPIGSFAAEMAGAIPTGMAAGGQLIGRGATVGARALAGLGVGGAQGSVYGFGASDGDVGERAQSALTTGVAGGLIGGAAPVIGAAARRVVSPSPASASQNAAAQVMAREGVTLTAGQRTGNKGLQYLEAELGKGRAADLMEQQAEQFTQAVLQRAGVQANRATPEVVDGAFTQLGQQFDNMAMLTNTPFDNQLQNDMLGVAADYLDTAANPAPVVERLVNRMGQLAQSNGGQMTGRVYQAMRSEIGRLMPAADPTTRMALRELQNALDDAVERNLNGQTLAAWQHLRRQYQNLLVVERAVTSGGEASASGLITPAQLRVAAKGTLGRRSVARGTNDFTQLANAGVQTMNPLPQSGTAPRLAAQAFGSIPAILGAAAGSPGGIPGALVGGAVGAAVPAIAGRAMLSGPGRAFLGNQWATGPQAGIVERSIRTLGVPALGATR